MARVGQAWLVVKKNENVLLPSEKRRTIPQPWLTFVNGVPVVSMSGGRDRIFKKETRDLGKSSHVTWETVLCVVGGNVLNSIAVLALARISSDFLENDGSQNIACHVPLSRELESPENRGFTMEQWVFISKDQVVEGTGTLFSVSGIRSLVNGRHTHALHILFDNVGISVMVSSSRCAWIRPPVENSNAPTTKSRVVASARLLASNRSDYVCGWTPLVS